MGSLTADPFTLTRGHVDTDRPSTRDLASRPLSRDFSSLSSVGDDVSIIVIVFVTSLYYQRDINYDVDL